MAVDPKDPDAALVAVFKHQAVKDDAKTKAEGRPIFKDIEVVEIRFPGSRAMYPFPAHAVSHWRIDPYSGDQVQITYAERFSRQYRQFKEHASQTKSGTPLEHAPFLTEARRAELRALNVYTVEQLAHIDGQELKNLGPGGRDLKNGAQEYIAEAKSNAPNLQMQAELEALRAQNMVLADDLERAKKPAPSASDEFADMSDDQLRDFIKVHVGHAPQGNINRKTLVRMATDARPNKAA